MNIGVLETTGPTPRDVEMKSRDAVGPVKIAADDYQFVFLLLQTTHDSMAADDRADDGHGITRARP